MTSPPLPPELRCFSVGANSKKAEIKEFWNAAIPASQPPELRYFPLPHGKKEPPLVKRFYDLAVPLDQFERGDHNIGVSTTGLLVVDLDVQKGGFESLDTLEMAHDDLPRTYTVKTPRGGKHLYFKAPHDVANSVAKIRKGIDIRACGGYVVGAGSWTAESVNSAEGFYEVEIDAPIADAPEWLVEVCGKPKDRAERLDDVAELDTPQAVARATEYLVQADPAVQGAGGDLHTFKTAAAAIDFGLTIDTAFDLMAEHWNERCSPPWQPDELRYKVENARNYRSSPVGSSDPKQEFDVWVPPAGADVPAKLRRQGVSAFDASTIRKRRWLYGRALIRGKVTAMVAPPGMGKSTFTIQMAVSVATGRDLLGLGVHERCPVWLYNNEDDLEELHRRLGAICQEFGIERNDLNGWLSINSGEQHRFTIAKRNGQGAATALRPTEDLETVAQEMAKGKIGLLIVDPFVETHEGDENDNVQMGFVTGLYRHLAQRQNASVCIVHHTRKPPSGSNVGHAGSMDSARGASSFGGTVRVGLTLYSMSEKDAADYGVLATQRHRHVRLDYSKGTFSPPSGTDPLWFTRESVDLQVSDGNDSVGVLKPAALVRKASNAEEDSSKFDDVFAAALRTQPVLSMRDAVALARENPLTEDDPKRLRAAIKRAVSPLWLVHDRGESLAGRPDRYEIHVRSTPSKSGGGKPEELESDAIQ